MMLSKTDKDLSKGLESPSAEAIKLSKDRINAMRNTSASTHYTLKESSCTPPELKTEKQDRQSWTKKKGGERKEDDDEKDKCEGSDTETEENVGNSFVLSRIANYESSPFTRRIKISQNRLSNRSKKQDDNDEIDSAVSSVLSKNRLKSTSTSRDQESTDKHKIDNSGINNKLSTQDHEKSVIQKIQSHIEDLEDERSNSNFNVIFENKEVLKLLSNKHLANLNIKVEKKPNQNEKGSERIADNRLREVFGSFRASKHGVRSSFRSSRKRKKNRQNRQNNNNGSNNKKDEEKGASDSNKRENETTEGTNSSCLSTSLQDHKSSGKNSRESPYEYIKKRFPEYAKLSKKSYCPAESNDLPPLRSLSTSPIERAPVVKKICSSGTRLKKDSEPTHNANTVKKKESFRGTKASRRNSITYLTRPNQSFGASDPSSFVQAQATRLRRKNSRTARRSEYRVSVTIRPSTVADLANKFNTIISKNKHENEVISGNVHIGTNFDEPTLKSYKSPRASFKRKYRHKVAKASKEHKVDEKVGSGTTDRTLSPTRRSLSNSLAELNMKDLFDDGDYNKTDEEKVCEKIKTALASGKFKGETDDSEDDLSFKKQEEEDILEEGNMDEPVEDRLEFKDKKVSGVPETTENANIQDIPQIETLYTDEKKAEQLEIADTPVPGVLETITTTETPKMDEKIQTEINNFTSIETIRSVDSGISSMKTQSSDLPEDSSQDIETIDKVAKEDTNDQQDSTKPEDKSEKHPNVPDLNSEDSHSEISSICSEAKTKKKGESSIYTSLKGVVKNTVKKTKEKDAERKDSERGRRRNRSPSQEREKWYKRGRSKERKPEKQSTETKSGTLKREGKLYELWPFKRFREKSQERPGEKSLKQKADLSRKSDVTGSESETYQDVAVSTTDASNEEVYGKLKFASRSRPREKKVNKTSSDAPKSSTESSGGADLRPDAKDKDTENDASNTEDSSIYGAVLPSSKTIPPPPKTPIPSPPSSFKRLIFRTKPKPTKQSEVNPQTEPSCSKAKKDGTENDYENMYNSPEFKRFQKTRLKLEKKGIKPNSSFLWSEAAQLASIGTTGTRSTEAETGERQGDEGETSSNKSSSSYDKVGLPPQEGKSESPEPHNYTEIQNNSSGDSQTGYDEIGPGTSSVSYDEIGSPPSCKYDDFVSPPNTSYDSLKPPSEGYDPVIPPKSDSSQYDECEGVVKAQLAMVKEYQSDTFSYLYDDIAMYNASQLSHSYEPICPPDDVPMQHSFLFNKLKQPKSSSLTTPKCKTDFDQSNTLPERAIGSDESENEFHEVFSYKLTAVGKLGFEKTSPGQGSAAISPKPKPKIVTPLSKEESTKPKKRVKKASSDEFEREFCHRTVDEADEWIDVSERVEGHRNQVVLMTQVPLSRVHVRTRRPLRPRVYRRPWTEVVRKVAHSTNLQAPPRTQGKQFPVLPYSAQTPSEHSKSGGQQHSSHRHHKRVESENDEEAGGHYEAIYEVISPSEGGNLPDEVLLQAEDDYSHHEDLDPNDSFESDDSDEAYTRLHPQSCKERLESFSSDVSSDKERDTHSARRSKYARSQSYQTHSINKIAEAANLGMKRLRRNWSLTKNEVRTGLNRIKKKSTFSMSDMKSSENLYEATYPQDSDKAKWSLKSRFRTKSTSSSTIPSSLNTPSPSQSSSKKSNKDSPTFYVTVTIASDGQEGDEAPRLASSKSTRSEDQRIKCSNLERRKSTSSSVSSLATSTSCETVASCRSRPHSATGANLMRNISSKSCGTLPRPKTAPPAPPPPNDKDDDSDYETAKDITKDQLALKLNQLLSSGPMVPPGRRVLKTSDDSSSDSSPVSKKLPSEDSSSRPHSLKHSHTSPSSLSFCYTSPSSLSMPPELTSSASLSLPQNRSSIVSSSSHGSSEGYIRPSEIASQPPPLPARPITTSSGTSLKRHSQPLPPPTLSLFKESDSKSYLDFTCTSASGEEPAYMISHFADEPLYQFYTAKVERAALMQGDYSSEDDYEVINDGTSVKPDVKQVRPSAMEIVTPADGRRTLWCELPEVVSSGILNKISTQERKLQEAMFEVITSEASYVKSLNVLVTHFMNCPDFSREEDPVITARERKVLFSDIFPVKKSSETFLADLENRWQESFEITSITDIILRHSSTSMVVYVKYCSNQIYQERMLRNLKENNPRFLEVLTRLESSPICQSLAMHSFLMLPMQRITRLPLLLDAIFNRLEYASPQWEECKMALASITKIVAECNEGARKMERMEEMLLVSRQLDFREVKGIPLISASRWLVKKGELTRLTWRENDAKLTFGRKISKHCLYFFLFSDLLVVTKKKGEEMHAVLDYCPRNMVQVLELESADKFPGRLLDGHKNLIIMTMLQNHENRTVEMVLSCPRESDRTRWMQALTPRTSDNPDERIYEEWDCPQVQVTHSYASIQPDELALEVSDVINVLKKTSDGWYQGERLRDGERGWFPGNHTVEIASAHVRARNLRQRYRLLAISGSFVDELKKEKERIEKEEKKKDRRRTITIKEVL